MQTDSGSTILCPVDFSEVSAHALRQAAILARRRDARILALHASRFEAPPYFTEASLAGLEREFRESLSSARVYLDSFVAAALDGDTARVEPRVVEMLPADAILAESTGAGLIVMGTHGRTGWNRWTLGSVAERVLRESAIPVLTVRGAPRPEIRRILCPVNDTGASRNALAQAVGLAAGFDATVTVLHVREPHGAAPIDNLCAWASAETRRRCDIREMTVEGDAAEEIVRLTAAEPYDLLVLGAPRRRFFEGMILGTTAIRAVRHAACPVLSVPDAPAQ